jgi:uncharacterized protein
MKFLQEVRPAVNVVTGYAPSAIQLGPRRLEGPVALSAAQVLHPWATAPLAELAFEHFAEVLAWQPEILLLGTGERQQFPAAALMGSMLSRRIGFEVMDSRAACRTYNVLVSESRAVALALL